MKRLKLLLVLFLTLSLTGCVQAYNISDEQSDAVAEYMAGLLLSYDRNYDQELLPVKEDTEDSSTSENTADFLDSVEEEIGEEDSSVDSSSDEDEESVDSSSEDITTEDNQQDYTLTQVIDEDGFTFQYKGYQLVEMYPEDPESANFSLTPREGYQLLVATILVKNNSESEKEINLIKSGITYQLDVNVNAIYKPLLTLLENDLQYIDIKIAAGKSKKALLIFEVSKQTDISNINLIATKHNKSVILELK